MRAPKSEMLEMGAIKKLSFMGGISMLLGKMAEGGSMTQHLTIGKADGTEVTVTFKLKSITKADGTKVKLR